MSNGLSDCSDLLEMAVEEEDEGTVDEVVRELDQLKASLEKLEFRRIQSDGEAGPIQYGYKAVPV